jgi:hypothetical protein
VNALAQPLALDYQEDPGEERGEEERAEEVEAAVPAPALGERHHREGREEPDGGDTESLHRLPPLPAPAGEDSKRQSNASEGF